MTMEALLPNPQVTYVALLFELDPFGNRAFFFFNGWNVIIEYGENSPKKKKSPSDERRDCTHVVWQLKETT